jgi:hypothetical protein
MESFDSLTFHCPVILGTFEHQPSPCTMSASDKTVESDYSPSFLQNALKQEILNKLVTQKANAFPMVGKTCISSGYTDPATRSLQCHTQTVVYQMAQAARTAQPCFLIPKPAMVPTLAWALLVTCSFP